MYRKLYCLNPGQNLRHDNCRLIEVDVDYEYRLQIDMARTDLRDLIIRNRCAPIMLRLAWQDAATYDAGTKTGGPTGSIRFQEAYSQLANNGLKFALDLCEEVKSKYPKITYADLYQLAGVVAVEVAGGPKITFTPGRLDLPTFQSEWSRLPSPTADADHLRLVFYRMGLMDREIVALSGAHTLGRAHPETSGYEGHWTDNPMKFDNSYFVALTNPESEGLLRLPTDNVLIKDPVFRQYVQHYAQDIKAFFSSYAEAHRKFSQLGYTALPNEHLTDIILLLTGSAIVLGAFNYFYGDVS